jgi:mutator protein MutT
VSVKLVLVAACALVDVDGRVLLTERPAGKPMAGLWEFPGGKVEAGERPEDTLIREMKEELDIVVREPCLAPLTFASHGYPPPDAALCLSALGGNGDGKGRPKARVGPAQPAARLQDAAGG